MSVIRVALVLISIVLTTSWSGLAFFPESGKFFSQVEEQLKGLQTFQVEITFPADPSLTLFLWQKGKSWRQEWVQDRGGHQAVVGAGIGFGSSLMASYPRVQDFPQPALNFWYRQPLQEWLQEMGIDLSIQSYQFLGHRPCLVFGARYGESNRAQIWIDNELSVPRKITTWKGVQWIWSGYYRVGNFRLPHRARVQFPFDTTVEMTLNWRAVNRDLPEKLFRSDAFAEKFSSAGLPEVDSRVYELFFTQIPPARL